MLSDLRFVLRSLARNRGFTLVTVLTLALGIGAAAAIFSVTDWILFRANKLPDDVVFVAGNSLANPFSPIQFGYAVQAYEKRTDVMQAWGKAVMRSGNIVIGDQPVGTGWAAINPELFSMMAVRPALGRGFLPEETEEGSDQVVVVTDSFSRRHLGGRGHALGRTITTGGAVCTVVGVLAPWQQMPPYLDGSEVFRPLAVRDNPATPWDPVYRLFGKLRPGLTRDQAQERMRSLRVKVPPELLSEEGNRPVLLGLGELKNQFRPEIYWVMVGAVAFLYAIACLNATNLLLVRQLGRHREFSIRLAVGGGRRTVVRLLVLESLAITVLAGGVGAFIANSVFPLLLKAAGGPWAVDEWSSWNLSWRTIGVLGMLSLVTSLLVVLVPVIRIWRTAILGGLKDGGGTSGESRRLARLRGGLVVGQCAFALVLLVGAGLMIQTFRRFEQVDLGFSPTNRAKVQLAFSPASQSTRDERLAQLRRIRGELLRLPGVRAVGFGSDFLLRGWWRGFMSVAAPDGTEVKTALYGFGPEMPEAAGLRLVCGRWVDQSHLDEVVVNETLARTCWPGLNPLGQRLHLVGPFADPMSPGCEVVGVIGDLRSSMREGIACCVYGSEHGGMNDFDTCILKLSSEVGDELEGLVRQRLFALDPSIVVSRVVSITGLRDQQLGLERMADSVLKVLAAIALLLTLVGVFSVLAYTVDRRKGEFGVRMALGATGKDLVALVLRRGLRLSLLGLVLGLGGAAALTRSLQSLLFETSALDPWVMVAVAAVLFFSSFAACVLPARRAARVDVSHLLRSE